MNIAVLADRIAHRLIEAQAVERGQIRAVVLAVLHEQEIAADLDELEARKTDPVPGLDEPFSDEEHRESER